MCCGPSRCHGLTSRCSSRFILGDIGLTRACFLLLLLDATDRTDGSFLTTTSPRVISARCFSTVSLQTQHGQSTNTTRSVYKHNTVSLQTQHGQSTNTTQSVYKHNMVSLQTQHRQSTNTTRSVYKHNTVSL